MFWGGVVLMWFAELVSWWWVLFVDDTGFPKMDLHIRAPSICSIYGRLC